MSASDLARVNRWSWCQLETRRRGDEQWKGYQGALWTIINHDQPNTTIIRGVVDQQPIINHIVWWGLTKRLVKVTVAVYYPLFAIL